MGVRLKYAIFWTVVLLVVLVGVKLWEISFDISFYRYGVYPRQLFGLRGIFLAPFIHSDFKHLYSNAIVLAVLSVALFYFYPKVALRVFFCSLFLPYVLVWFIGREAYHTGASGTVYALTSFHLFASLITRRRSMLAFSLIIIFLYGSAIWGMLPSLAYDRSWEAHFSGYLAGLICALLFISKPKPPQEKRFFDFKLKADLPVEFDYEYKEKG